MVILLQETGLTMITRQEIIVVILEQEDSNIMVK